MIKLERLNHYANGHFSPLNQATNLYVYRGGAETVIGVAALCESDARV